MKTVTPMQLTICVILTLLNCIACLQRSETPLWMWIFAVGFYPFLILIINLSERN